jgi:hypothetical protein
MVIRAKSVSSSGTRSAEVGVHSSAHEINRVEELPDDDNGIVMVMFPMATWQKIQEMARAREVGPAEVISVALELLDDRMKDSVRKAAE